MLARLHQAWLDKQQMSAARWMRKCDPGSCKLVLRVRVHVGGCGCGCVCVCVCGPLLITKRTQGFCNYYIS